MTNAAPYILLADDDVDDHQLLVERFLLANPHATFKLCQNGEEALQHLFKCTAEELPDILLLDYKMPIMTGAEVLQKIQGNSRFQFIRKFVWSTSDQLKYADECRQCGAEKYFTKPNCLSELDQMIGCIVSLMEIAASGQQAGI